MAGAKNNLPTKVLVVDNDPASTKNVENILAKHDVSVMGANNRENAIYLFNQNKFALVMLAMAIDDIPGTTLIQKWRNHETESKRDTAYIVMTGQQVKSTDEQLIRELGDIFTIAKPFKEPVLLGILARAMQAFDNHAALSDVGDDLVLAGLGNRDVHVHAAVTFPRHHCRWTAGPLFDHRVIEGRRDHPEPGSYTNKLLEGGDV